MRGDVPGKSAARRLLAAKAAARGFAGCRRRRMARADHDEPAADRVNRRVAADAAGLAGLEEGRAQAHRITGAGRRASGIETGPMTRAVPSAVASPVTVGGVGVVTAVNTVSAVADDAGRMMRPVSLRAVSYVLLMMAPL